MSRVRDWQRLRPGVPVVDEPEAAPGGGGNGYGYAPSAMEEMQAVRLQRLQSRSMSAEEIEQLEDEDLARLQRVQTRMAMIRALQGGGGDSNQLAPMLQQLIQSNQESQRAMLNAIHELQRGQRDDAVLQMKQTITALEAKLTDALTRQTAPAAAPDAASALRSVISELGAVRDFRHTLDEVLETPGQAQGMVSRDQALQELKVNHQMKLAQLELDDRIADHREARVQAEREYELKRRRLDNAFGTAQQVLPAVAAALLGDKAKDLFGAIGGGTAPAPPPSGNGHAPHIASPPDPPPLGLPGMQEWQCPSCNALNESTPTTMYATCARCGTEVEPFPQDDAGGAPNGHDHTIIDLPPRSDTGPNGGLLA